MKINKLVIVLLIIALFIPAYIGIANYLYIKNTPVTVQNAAEIQIKDNVSGLVFSEKPDSDIAKLFTEISTGTKTIKIEALPEGLSGENNFIVTSISGDRKTDSFYYFLKDSGTGYYVDDKGTAYRIDESHVTAFLETKYAQSLYEEAYLPMLTSGDNVILPTNYTWTYKTASGNARFESVVTKKADGTVTYNNESSADLTFSRTPDSFVVSVKDANGTEKYSGEYSGISGLDSRTLVFNATAVWNETDTMPYGSATYSFVIEIASQPEFLIAFSGKEGNKFEPGDIAFITATDVSSPEKITFKSEPALTHNNKEITPTFYSDGENAYALLPTAYDTAPGEYVLTFTYGGTPHILNMTIEEKWFNTNSPFNVSAARVAASYTAETLTAYENFVNNLIANGDFSEKHFTDEILGSAASKSSKARGYGKPRPVDLGTLGDSYTPDGMDYTTDGKILADMNGEVVAVEYTELSGYMVVIDHGYGLLSFYRCLDKDSILVTKGDVVKTGDVICEKVGDSGFTDGKTLRYAVTVNSVPVNPADLWESGILFK